MHLVLKRTYVSASVGRFRIDALFAITGRRPADGSSVSVHYHQGCQYVMPPTMNSDRPTQNGTCRPVAMATLLYLFPHLPVRLINSSLLAYHRTNTCLPTLAVKNSCPATSRADTSSISAFFTRLLIAVRWRFARNMNVSRTLLRHLQISLGAVK